MFSSEGIFTPQTDTEKKARNLVGEVGSVLQKFEATDAEVENLGKKLIENAYDNMEYIRCVFEPDKADPARYPTEFPVPTGLIKNRDSFNVKTNSSGNAIVQFSPNARFSHTNSYNDDVYAIIANGNLLNISGSNTYETILDDNIGAPSDSWWGNAGETFGSKRMRFNANPVCSSAVEKYRVVAFGVKVWYIGKELYKSGTIEMANFPDTASEDFVLVSQQNLEDQMFHHIEKYPDKGIRHITFPIDQNSNMYVDVTQSVTNLMLIQLIISGAESLNNCIKVQVTRVLEYIPTASYREIVTPSIPKGMRDGLNDLAVAVRVNPKTVGSKEGEYSMQLQKTYNWWDKLKPWISRFITPTLGTIGNFIAPGAGGIIGGVVGSGVKALLNDEEKTR